MVSRVLFVGGKWLLYGLSGAVLFCIGLLIAWFLFSLFGGRSLDFLKQVISSMGKKFILNEEGLVRSDGKRVNKITEGEMYRSYKDPKGNLTIGVGSLVDTPEELRISDDLLTAHYVNYLFDRELEVFGRIVRDLVKVPLKQNQFDALVSFTFNVGPENFKRSRILDDINAGRQITSEHFTAWENHARRLREFKLFQG